MSTVQQAKEKVQKRMLHLLFRLSTYFPSVITMLGVLCCFLFSNVLLNAFPYYKFVQFIATSGCTRNLFVYTKTESYRLKRQNLRISTYNIYRPTETQKPVLFSIIIFWHAFFWDSINFGVFIICYVKKYLYSIFKMYLLYSLSRPFIPAYSLLSPMRPRIK